MFSSQAFLSLARFADNQYQVIVDYMKSSTFENKQNLMKKAKVRHGGGGGGGRGAGKGFGFSLKQQKLIRG